MSDQIGSDFDPFALGSAVEIPSTPGQYELWLASQADGGAGNAYNESFQIRLTGFLNEEALQSALTMLSGLHEGLRGHFSTDGERFIIEPEMPVVLGRHAGRPLDEVVDEFSSRPYNLTEGPLFRADLVRGPSDEAVVLFGAHHTVSDGWSLDVLLYDLGRLYTSLVGLGPLPSPPTHGISDFAALTQSKAYQEKIEASRRFWKEKFAILPPVLSLPADGDRPLLRTYGAHHARKVVPEGQANAIRTWAKAHHQSFFSVLLAAFGTTVHRISGAQDFIIGIPVAGHPDLDMEDCVGHLANVVPVRFSVTAETTFEDLCNQTASGLLDAREHAQIGFGDLVANLKVPRDPSRVPFVTCIFTHVQKYTRSKLRFGDLGVDYRINSRKFEIFEWTLNALESQDNLEVLAHVNSDLYSTEWIGNRLDDLFQVLAEGITSPGVPITQLPLVSREKLDLWVAEKKQLTLESGYLGKTFLDLFRLTCAKTPDAEALWYNGEVLTFQALDKESDLGAETLVKAGVKPRDFVGVYLNRDERLVPALISVFKAGAGYVPLDPHFPQDRLKILVADSGIRFIVTDQAGSQAPLFVGSPVTRVLWEDRQSEVAPPLPAVESSFPAYMLFTSGSTGRPKGVPITQGALANLLLSTAKEPGMAARDRVLALTTMSFDISCLEFYLALTVGGTVVLADDDTSADPEALAALIKREKVTFLQTTPSRMTLLLESGWAPDKTMRLILGGEAFPKTLAKRLQATGADVWNGYGPTETAIYSSVHRIVDTDRDIPIGHPVANTQFYVLDTQNRVVPPGIPGELAIGGAGMSPGYFGRPDLNAGRFITLEGGITVYKTGDLVQAGPDEVYKYLGRIDFQVKIRGFRIELGEVEATLEKFPGLLEAVCNVWTRSENDKRLVAYYRSETDLDLAAVDAELRKVLPDYMVPGHYIRMESFPRTPSGKVERKAFPNPDDSAASVRTRTITSPRNLVETQILEVWKEVLAQNGFGVTESFFDLGGHSLLAPRLLRGMNQKMGTAWTLRDLFAHPTVEGFAALAVPGAPTSAETQEIPRRTDRTRAPLSPAQERLWFLHEMDPDKPLYNLVHTLRTEGFPDLARLERALRKFFDRHDLFRASILKEDGQPYLNFAENAEVPLETFDWSGQGEEKATQAFADRLRTLARLPLDFSRFPVSRAVIGKISESVCLTGLLVPHIFSDGWSSDLFLNEVQALYDHDGDQAWELPALPIDFGDYAAWEQERRKSGVRDHKSEAFWKEYLKGIPEAHDLPLDRPRPKDPTGLGQMIRFSLDGPTSDRIRTLCHRLSVTPNMYFLACLTFLLRKYSSLETLVLGTPYANRELQEVRGLSGYFIRTIPLRFDVDLSMDFARWLGYVKAQFLRAWEHSSLGLDELVELLGVPRTTNVNPIYQILFAFQSYSTRGAATGAGTRFSQVVFDRGVSENDLAFYMWESDRFEGTLEFAEDIFDRAGAEGLAASFTRVAEVLAQNPGEPLGRISLVDDKTRTAVVRAGRVRAPAPDLAQAFRLRVQGAPDRTAVEFGGLKLSYGDLDRASDRIAFQLAALGAASGSRVAVALPRGTAELTTLLAVVKAGAAYVPLDPTHPADRIQTIFDDASPRVLVAAPGSPLADRLPPGTRILELTEADLDPGSQGHHLFVPTSPPGEVAYVLFTSGSTGRPKGVEVPRRAFANFLASMADQPGLGSTDRVLAITTTTFDIAGLELFLPLAVGACVIIADRDTAGDPVRLRDLAETSQVSLIQATPATWRLLLDAGWTGRPGLKLLCGGEALSLALAQRLLAGGAELWNMYGPTETTVWSTLEPILPGVDRITIGQPIDNTQVSLRDPGGLLVPDGVIGEICIAGEGLALGYCGRPDLTADRFPTDPLTATRYYKTGDLGRYLPDGRLECLGRVDFQVKVRGFRIELGDIEAQLRTVTGVTEVLATARPNGDGDPLLAVYWTGSASKEALILKAREKLPQYMVPAAYVRLDSFPLTTSGKIDRKGLPPPEDVAMGLGGMRPKNDRESIMASLWREVLGIPFVAVDENFFTLGGTSIRAIRLRKRIHDTFGLEIPLRTLFEYPTIEGLVTRLGAPSDENAPIVLRLSSTGTQTPWFGIMGIQLYEDLALALGPDYPVVAVHVPVRYNPRTDRMPGTRQIAARYVEVIRACQPHGPYFLFGLCYGGLVAYEAAVQLQDAGEEVGVVGVLDTVLPRALSVRPFKLVGYLLTHILRAPGRIFDWTRKKLERGGEAVNDGPLDGPEVVAEMVRYQKSNRFLSGHLVSFRATKFDFGPWHRLNPDSGWTGMAARLSLLEVPAGHLEIVREPHSVQVARTLTEVRRNEEAADKEKTGQET